VWAAAVTCAFAGAAQLAAGCGGGGATCGNGRVEGNEECDDGNNVNGDGCDNGCVDSTNDVHMVWSLIGVEYPGFEETCIGVGASQAEFVFSGVGEPRTERVQCDFTETWFQDFDDGTYTVTGTLFDATDAAITKGQATAQFTVNGRDVDPVEIDFAFGDFTGSYTGNFYFRVWWGGVDSCDGAAPPVTQQVLRLERDGVPIPGATDVGDPIDGSAPAPCRPANPNLGSSQKVIGIPWGPARLIIEGRDASGMAQFQESFDTFVGAGVANPEYAFDVNSLAPDAGPADAAIPDAGVPDAAPAPIDAGAPAPDARPPDAG
jgi:cysteine-rich repeat protein